MVVDYSRSLLPNVHKGLPLPEDNGESVFVQGDYQYWHYGCDGVDDRGWGCGYRTLQTICSWVIKNGESDKSVPSIRTIQEILVSLEDKEPDFVGSREWIGSFEVCLVLDQRYEVASKIVHVPNGRDLIKHVDTVVKHFNDFGSPIMMGGDKDCSSKCVAGVHRGSRGIYLLIVDPHFAGKAHTVDQLQLQHWVKWQSLKDFVDSSFYNLCLPQVKCKDIGKK